MAGAEDSTTFLLLMTVGLVVLSAYFSSSETALMALNRARLKHLVNQRHRGARKANRLLGQSERLVGLLRLGNNLVKFYAGAIAAVLGSRFLPDYGFAIALVIITLLFLVFAEGTPKTIARQRPETLAFPSAYVLDPLLKLTKPLLIGIQAVSRFFAKPWTRDDGDTNQAVLDEMNVAEGTERRNMLLGVLDLGNVSVDEIMVPRSEIQGIDIDDDPAVIAEQIRSSQHTRLPVYRDEINDVIGVLHLRRASRFLSKMEFARADVLAETDDPYFVPEGTRLNTQLINFQNEKQRIGLVVDEYGEVQGIVTLEDILEEIVGEFTTDVASDTPEIHPQPDGGYLIEGKALLRDMNRSLGWDLPTSGPRTLNGLLLEHLELIPDANVCVRIGRFRFETLQIADNVVRTVRVDADPDPEQVGIV